MSELSRKARKENRAKAQRMAGGTDPHKRVDASSWTPPEPLNAHIKTGARPIRPRVYKAGGRVQGDRARRADKLPRENANAKAMVNTVAANKEKYGSAHVGGYKAGGKADEKQDTALVAKDVHKHERHLHKGEKLTKLATGGRAEKCGGGRMAAGGKANYLGGTRPTGGRIAKADGGAMKTQKAFQDADDAWGSELRRSFGKKAGDVRYTAQGKGAEGSDLRRLHDAREAARGAWEQGRQPRANGGRTKGKGKTNINITIGSPQGQQPMQMPPQGVVRPPPAPPPMPMGGPGMPPPGLAGGAAMPPPSMGGAPQGPGGPPPPMPRKRGGRTSADMSAGSLSGEGRLQKTDIQRNNRKAGGKVYRSAKDLDAGSLSGIGRLEKSEIQAHKR